MAFLISVGNGRTVKVNTLDDLLNFDYQKAWAEGSGFEISNPFLYSTLDTGDGLEDEDFFTLELPDISGLDEADLNEDLD